MKYSYSLALPALLSLLFVNSVTSTPAWNEGKWNSRSSGRIKSVYYYYFLDLLFWPYDIRLPVNGYYPNGTECPLPTYYAYQCPRICVRDISQCPEQVRPSCAPGLTFCVDGSCRESCPSNLVSACACPGAPDLVGDLYPCQDTQTVNIVNFDSDNSSQPYDTCAAAIGIGNIPSWVPNPYSMMWGKCPTPDYGKLNFHEPVFIALYVFYGSCVASLLGWTAYKQMRERVIKLKYRRQQQSRVDEYYESGSNEEKKAAKPDQSVSSIILLAIL